MEKGRGGGFVRARGNHFILDGHPSYWNGFNAYFLMAISVASNNTRYRVSGLLEEAKGVGLNLARTWAFNDAGYQALQISPGVYDQNVFQALDFVVSEAQRIGIHLILTLANNWKDYGGKDQYVKWGKDAGLPLNSEDDFFSDPTVKGYFKNHIKAVLTRVNSITGIPYKNDPTIFAWELMNEPRCLSDPSGKTLQAWIEEMASYVKSIDNNHMLTVGSEGFYGPVSSQRQSENPNTYCQQLGTDFINNYGVPGIDFAMIHAYPDDWIGSNLSMEQKVSFMCNWLNAHEMDCTYNLRKPLLLGEFGVSDKLAGYSSSNREAFMAEVYRDMVTMACSGGSCAGVLLWQLFPEGMDEWSDGYSIVLSQNPSIGAMIADASKKLQGVNEAIRKMGKIREEEERRWEL